MGKEDLEYTAVIAEITTAKENNILIAIICSKKLVVFNTDLFEFEMYKNIDELKEKYGEFHFKSIKDYTFYNEED
jgi:hypothetical protein